MERLRSLTLAAAVAAALAPGCIHVHTDADGKVKSVELKTSPAAEPAAPADPNVKPAAATVPAPAVAGAAAGLAKLAPKLPAALGGAPQASGVIAIWQNRIAQLPDPTANGAFKPGLVGQLFLVGAKTPFVPADGKVTIELFDATPRAGAPAEPARLGSWTFQKDVLNQLVTTDERFGKSYALFLPWPTYTPAVTRVRMTAKYEPEHGFVLHAEPMTVTIDTSVGGDGSPAVRTAAAAPTPGPVLMPATPQPGPGAFPVSPAGPPIPIHPPTPGPTAAGPPPGLPPLALTLPGH